MPCCSPPEGIGAVGMMLNFIVTITVTHMTKPPPPEIQDNVETIRYPKGSEV